jgi:arsenate reductase (thioredoxin)
MRKTHVLFICRHNSARSQMAEAWCNTLCGDFLEAESAGLEPGDVNPLVVRAMREVGIDISHKGTQDVFELVKSDKLFSFVISVCDRSTAERCPIFAGITTRLDWSFPDPGQLTGTDEDKLSAIRRIRDAIRERVLEWSATLRTSPAET